MFAPTYFAPTYFPGRYFPTGASGVVPDVPLKYFPGDYFPRTYFPGDYFPVGSTSISTGYPAGLPEAVGRLIESIPALASAGLAACWTDSKPRGAANPCLVLKCPTGTLWITDDVHDVHTLRPTLTVMASTKAEADSLGELVCSTVRGSTLVYGSEGEIKTYPFMLQARKRSKDEAETVGGDRVFRDVSEWMVREIRPR